MIAKIKNTIDRLRKENHSEKKKSEFLNRRDKIGDIQNQSGKTSTGLVRVTETEEEKC